MRNSNSKDIVIHSLVDKKQNKADSKIAKYDYCEELSIKEKKALKLAELRAKQLKKEQKGQWVKIVTEHGKFQIFIPKGKNIEKMKNQFIEKLSKRR